MTKQFLVIFTAHIGIQAATAGLTFHEHTPRAKGDCQQLRKLAAPPDYIIYYMATVKMQSFHWRSPSALWEQRFLSFLFYDWVGCPGACLKRQKCKSTAWVGKDPQLGSLQGLRRKLEPKQWCLTSNLLLCELISLETQQMKPPLEEKSWNSNWSFEKKKKRKHDV